MKNRNQPETVGRKFTREFFALNYRAVDSEDPVFLAGDRYPTYAEARAALDRMGSRFQRVGGGLTLDTGEAEDLYEYRIVKWIAQCEVVHTEIKKI